MATQSAPKGRTKCGDSPTVRCSSWCATTWAARCRGQCSRGIGVSERAATLMRVRPQYPGRSGPQWLGVAPGVGGHHHGEEQEQVLEQPAVQREEPQQQGLQGGQGEPCCPRAPESAASASRDGDEAGQVVRHGLGQLRLLGAVLYVVPWRSSSVPQLAATSDRTIDLRRGPRLGWRPRGPAELLQLHRSIAPPPCGAPRRCASPRRLRRCRRRRPRQRGVEGAAPAERSASRLQEPHRLGPRPSQA